MKLSYPGKINDSVYNDRRVTIYVMETSVSETAANALAGIKNFSQDVVQSAKSVYNLKEMVTNKQSNNNKRDAESTHVATIVLPLPNSLSDTQNHEWSNESGILNNSLKTAAYGTVDTAIGTLLTNAKRRIKSRNKEDTSTDTMSANGVTEGVIAQASSFLSIRKPLFNPGYFQNYSGSTPRTFTMDWEFMPNNTEEAHAIISIIMSLKQYSLPTKCLYGVSLLAPNYFSVEISNKYISEMVGLDRVVISNISVNYSSDGNMQQTSDGMPKIMSLSLTFNEVDMLTQEDFTTK